MIFAWQSSEAGAADSRCKFPPKLYRDGVVTNVEDERWGLDFR